MRNFNIANTLKDSRIIEIRDRWYSPQVVNEYPILLVSEDHGKTWSEKNIRGMWNLFPMLDVLQLDNPIVDIISSEGTIYIISKSKYGTWDSTTGFYFSYKSNDEGKSWERISQNISDLGRVESESKPHEYAFFLDEKDLFFTQDKSKVIQP